MYLMCLMCLMCFIFVTLVVLDVFDVFNMFNELFDVFFMCLMCLMYFVYLMRFHVDHHNIPNRSHSPVMTKKKTATTVNEYGRPTDTFIQFLRNKFIVLIYPTHAFQSLKPYQRTRKNHITLNLSNTSNILNTSNIHQRLQTYCESNTSNVSKQTPKVHQNKPKHIKIHQNKLNANQNIQTH